MVNKGTVIIGAAILAAVGFGYLWWQCKQTQAQPTPPATQWFRPNQ